MCYVTIPRGQTVHVTSLAVTHSVKYVCVCACVRACVYCVCVNIKRSINICQYINLCNSVYIICML